MARSCARASHSWCSRDVAVYAEKSGLLSRRDRSWARQRAESRVLCALNDMDLPESEASMCQNGRCIYFQATSEEVHHEDCTHWVRFGKGKGRSDADIAALVYLCAPAGLARGKRRSHPIKSPGVARKSDTIAFAGGGDVCLNYVELRGGCR